MSTPIIGDMIGDLIPLGSPMTGNELIEIESEGKTRRVSVRDLPIHGKDGITVFEEWQQQEGNEEKTFDDYLEAIKGDTGLNPVEYWLSLPENEGKTEQDYNEAFKGIKGDQGPAANPIKFFGPVEQLPNAEDIPSNHIYFKYVEDVCHTFTSDGIQWIDHGDFTGPSGLNAFELAILAGFVGSEEDWRESLQGRDGIGLRILGSFSDIIYLPEQDMVDGDAYIIQEKMYVWAGVSWEPVGQVGPRGKDSYRHAQDQGFVGTLDEWLASLVGPRGPDGKSALKVAMDNDPSITDYESWRASLKGDRGLRGKSALEVAIEEDEQVTDYTSWRAVLKGEPGKDAQTVTILNVLDSETDLPTVGELGFGYLIEGIFWGWTEDDQYKPFGKLQGSKGDSGIQGPRGKSALEVAIEEDELVIDYESWRESLRGAEGKNGKSAYQIALAINPDIGTEQQWLDSQKGEDGKDGKGLLEIVQATNPDIETETQLVEHMRGKNGKNALEVAMDNDPSITSYQLWQESLKGKDGVDGKDFTIEGKVDQVSNIPEDAQDGTFWRVADNLYQVMSGVPNDLGLWGLKGDQGIQGKSALDVAIEEDAEVVDYESWRASLKGEEGKPGRGLLDIVKEENPSITTEAQLVEHMRGEAGKSALEVAIEEDELVTDYASWKASLKGMDGQSLVPKGKVASVEDLEAITDPSDYDYWHVGTVAYVYFEGLWIDLGDLQGSKGDIGPDGKDALAVAMDNDPSITDYESWKVSLMGSDGLNTYETVRLLNPTIQTPEDFYAFIKGESGEEGPEGPVGPMGPALNILDEFSSEAELPSTGEIGEGYLIEGDFWGWSPALNAYKNLGKVQGPEGARGLEGKVGPRGPIGKDALSVVMENDPSITNYSQWQAKLKGVKGDRGQYWYVEPYDPGPVDGVIGDMFLNSSTQQIFRKTGQTIWAPMGYLGGGNVYVDMQNDKYFILIDGERFDMPFGPIFQDGLYFATNTGWARFDNYDLPVHDVQDLTIDVENHQVVRITLDGIKEVNVPNFTVPGRTKTLVIIVKGSAGALSFTGRVNWGDVGMPELGSDFTVFTMLWDSVDNQWLAAGGVSGDNLA